MNDGSLLPAPVVVDSVNNALNQIEFPESGFMGFSPSLESPHGSVHVLVGGNMGWVPTAARDPVFWLHHGNIDRLWDVWLSLGGRANPSNTPFLDKTYSFADERGDVVTVKVRDIISSVQLGYCYDNVPYPLPSAARAFARYQAELAPPPREARGAQARVAASSAEGKGTPGNAGKQAAGLQDRDGQASRCSRVAKRPPHPSGDTHRQSLARSPGYFPG
jgi:hypothetical protein